MWRTGLVAPRHVGSSRTRAPTRVPCNGRQILIHCATREAPFSFYVDSTPLDQGTLSPGSCISFLNPVLDSSILYAPLLKTLPRHLIAVEIQFKFPTVVFWHSLLYLALSHIPVLISYASSLVSNPQPTGLPVPGSLCLGVLLPHLYLAAPSHHFASGSPLKGLLLSEVHVDHARHLSPPLQADLSNFVFCFLFKHLY